MKILRKNKAKCKAGMGVLVGDEPMMIITMKTLSPYKLSRLRPVLTTSQYLWLKSTKKL